MNKICIIDDDLSIVNILKDIVSEQFKELEICIATSGKSAVEIVLRERPDILLLDYLLPDSDGLEVIRKVKEHYHPLIVMISEVSDKEMIAKAYDEDIEFFITKPINVIEIRAVLSRVIEYQNALHTFDYLDNAIHNMQQMRSVKPLTDEQKFRRFLDKLGVSGSAGCEEIIKAVTWVRKQQGDYKLSDMYLELIHQTGDTEHVYALKKRIRRVVTKAFKSMAILGIDDFMNPLFEEYAGRLFDFKEIHQEMRYLQGKSKHHGKINIRQFIESMSILIDS